MKHYLILPAVCTALFSFFSETSYAADPAEKPIRVLLVNDIRPGSYPMQGITMLRDVIRLDKRFEVALVENAEVLGTDLLFDYDVVLLAFKVYLHAPQPKRDAEMRANLEKFVREGGGLFVYHFACGAFEGWEGFEKLAGRVWDPRLPPHDPFQRFTVRIADSAHPVTAALADFEIDDELYTCLGESEVPIHILADAVSTVDGKTYPMAFVLENGKGRTFHTTLGHDNRALAAPEFQKMIREALVWCAQRENFTANTEVKILVEPFAVGFGASASEMTARLKEITDMLPEGGKLLAYFDCGGLGSFEAAEGGLTIVPPAEAKTWTFRPESPIENVPPQHFTVLFDTGQLPFLIEGLDRSKRYQLNVVWWDFDANGRVQALVVQSPGDLSRIRILRPGVALPDYMESGLPPRTVTVPLPMAFVRDGKLALNIRGESSANVVVSEIWINELP